MITIYDSDGFFSQSYDLADGDTPTVPSGGGYILGSYDGSQFYLLSGAPELRPKVTEEDVFQINSDNTEILDIPIPEDTVVTDYETGTIYVAGASESFQFKSAINGEWKFLIEPPFPYQASEITVNVDAN